MLSNEDICMKIYLDIKNLIAVRTVNTYVVTGENNGSAELKNEMVTLRPLHTWRFLAALCMDASSDANVCE